MSLFTRFTRKITSGVVSKPIISSKMGLKPLNPNWVNRKYGQLAEKHELDDVDEVEIDPRKLPADYDPNNFDPSCYRSPPSDRVFKLVDEVSALTLAEFGELGVILMSKMGLAEPPVMGVLKGGVGVGVGLGQMGGNANVGGVDEVKKEEKSVFDLKLEGFEASSKIKVIKEIRSFTELGLKEAKDLVDKAPAVFKKSVSKDEAELIIEKLKGVGAKVAME